MLLFKRGDDLEFLANNVRSRRPPKALLPLAALTWRFLRQDGTLVRAGTMTQYDAPTASYEGSVTGTDTASVDLFEECALEIVVINNGKKTSLTTKLKAVDALPQPQS
jgi:hypothetical protein